jgi:predicted  nucleic acid-binding Zn-ribbon protein
MKSVLLIITACLLMSTGVNADETGPGQARDIQAELREIRTQMDELVKNEAALRDRQTTRIMRLEEDLETTRQDLASQISQAGDSFSREHDLAMEYIEIINAELNSLAGKLDEQDAELRSLGSRMTGQEQGLDQVRVFGEHSRDLIQDFRQRLNSIGEKIAGLDQAVTEHRTMITSKASDIEEIKAVEQAASELSTRVGELESELSLLSAELEKDLAAQLTSMQELKDNILDEVSGLSETIQFTDQDMVEKITAAESRVSELKEHMLERELLASGAFVALGLVVLLITLLNGACRKKAARTEQSLEQKHSELLQMIEEQGTVLDTRLVEILEKQIPLLSGTDTPPGHPDTQDRKIADDHALAIVLGEEIYRLMKRRGKRPDELPVTEELKTSLRRLWTAFRKKGYELVDLQDKKYSEDMEARAEFFLTHELLPGEQVVSRVIRPLIRHKGVTIQEAEIEVMVGE